MQRRLARCLVFGGAALTVAGLIGAVVYQLQPWRSCPYDDSPAACAMLPEDYRAFLICVLVLLAGLIALLAALVLSVKTAQDSRRPAA